jgi:two-component system cell cycle response regulator
MPGEALDFIKAERDVSVLITSVVLSPMSGIELCWKTRLLTGCDRTIYIILMSSNSEEQHLINALDNGADELIRKPFASEELYARLRSAERLLRLQSELIRLASIDPLTGVFNRRVFFEQAEQTQRRSATHSVIMFDVDHFKQINDTYGHGVGDQVLGGIGREAAYRGGIVGRLGGEEFAILLEGAGLEAATAHAEMLRTRLAQLSFETGRGGLSVTCSLGVAEGQRRRHRPPAQAGGCCALPGERERPRSCRRRRCIRRRRAAMVGTAAVERARCRRRAVVGIDAARQAARRLDHDTIKFNRTAI